MSWPSGFAPFLWVCGPSLVYLALLPLAWWHAEVKAWCKGLCGRGASLLRRLPKVTLVMRESAKCPVCGKDASTHCHATYVALRNAVTGNRLPIVNALGSDGQGLPLRRCANCESEASCTEEFKSHFRDRAEGGCSAWRQRPAGRSCSNCEDWVQCRSRENGTNDPSSCCPSWVGPTKAVLPGVLALRTECAPALEDDEPEEDPDVPAFLED